MCANPIFPNSPAEVKPICADHAAADRLARELNDLIEEIIATTGYDWLDAVAVALAEFADLMAYADEWDAGVQ
jgi:hypothetical protein